MSDWLARYAEALGEEPLTPAEVAAVLDLARDVAHGTQRRFAPLSTYLAGVHAGLRAARDGGRLPALEDAATAARRLVDAPTDAEG